MTVSMYYVCKYTPLELLAGFGLTPERLDPAPASFECAETCAHPNLCGYGKAVLEDVVGKGIKALLLVDCCDVCRRIYDVLNQRGEMEFLFLMALPHKNGPAERALLERELIRLRDALAEYTGRAFDLLSAMNAWADACAEKLSDEPHIRLAGACSKRGWTLGHRHRRAGLKGHRMDENGNVENFVMNDKCAAGTGRFLEMMARTLEMSISEMSERGLRWKKDVAISSMCTVFAESEVVSLVAENTAPEDIIHGLNMAVASKTAALAQRLDGKPEYIMTGGVARNRGVVQALGEKLGERIFVPPEAQLCGALGAALIALGGEP